MGSFNVSCCLSGLSVSPGDKVVAVKLRKNKWAPKFDDKEPYFLSENCDSGLFVPDSLPVFRVYNDYGRLEDDYELNMHAVFHRNVWDSLTEMPELGTIMDDLPYAVNLKYFGFELIQEAEVRYGKMYKHPTLDVVLESDDTWVQINGKTYHTLKSLFHDIGFKVSESDSKIPSLFFMFKNDLEEYFLNKKSNDVISRLRLMVLTVNVYLRRFSFIEHMDSITDEQIKQLCMIRLMSQALFCTHRLWLPWISGPQCGERAIESFWLSKITETLKGVSNVHE